MKKILFYAFFLFSLSGAGELFANIDNLSNMSAEWIRTGNRNAATDAADIVVYNPAGVTELGDGIHLNVGNQTLMRKPEHSYDFGLGEEKHEQDGTDWFLPNLYATFNMGNWAVFGGYYICGGGATVNYPDGSFTTDLIGIGVAGAGNYSDEYLEADSYYNTFELGGAYKINEMFSIAVGARYLYVKNTVKAGFTAGGSELKVDLEDTGNGYGFIAGININLTKEINFAAQYQSQIDLKLETDVNRNDVYPAVDSVDGEKNRRDLPAVFGMGLGYNITDKLYAEINYSYWFQENCNWEKTSGGEDIAKMAGDAQSAGITASYRFLPEFLVSAGTTYTDFKWNDINGYYEANTGSYEVLYSDNWHIGCGVAYTVVENVVLNLSLAKTIWEDEELTNSNAPGVTIKTKNDTTIIALGADVKF